MKKKVLSILVLILAGGSIFIWLGVYNVAATDRHWVITNQILELIRERSIEARSQDIVVPILDDPADNASAAANYEEMCSVCHLAPGKAVTELHEGLYPKPLIFYQPDHEPQDARANFWVIKNGIKLTGMPAWGTSHSDEEIWSLVAFISNLEAMSAEEYQNITVSGKLILNNDEGVRQDAH